MANTAPALRRCTGGAASWYGTAALLSAFGLSAVSDALADEPEPAPAAVADTRRYVVSTYGDATYFGTLSSADDSKTELTITTASGLRFRVPSRDIAATWLDSALDSSAERQVVRSGCVGKQRPEHLIREVGARGQEPVRGQIAVVTVGTPIVLHHVGSSAPGTVSLAWQELDYIRRPPDVVDQCQTPSSGDGGWGALDRGSMAPAAATAVRRGWGYRQSASWEPAAGSSHSLPDYSPGSSRSALALDRALQSPVRTQARASSSSRPGQSPWGQAWDSS